MSKKKAESKRGARTRKQVASGARILQQVLLNITDNLAQVRAENLTLRARLLARAAEAAKNKQEAKDLAVENALLRERSPPQKAAPLRHWWARTWRWLGR
jgi:predicted nuclease with TOPRIM domain